LPRIGFRNSRHTTGRRCRRRGAATAKQPIANSLGRIEFFPRRLALLLQRLKTARRRLLNLNLAGLRLLRSLAPCQAGSALLLGRYLRRRPSCRTAHFRSCRLLLRRQIVRLRTSRVKTRGAGRRAQAALIKIGVEHTRVEYAAPSRIGDLTAERRIIDIVLNVRVERRIK
jgi:hypothetical protein